MDNEAKTNILIVDDLPEKILVFRTILECLGQNLVTALSGREALRHLLDREFAVILLDVNMPDMDGFETAAMIRNRRQTADTPIIFITAFSDEMHTAQGYSLGAVDYILTPVVPAILCTKVGVFVDLYNKTRQVEFQAEERIILAREQAARAAAEEATRRSAFLAEASTVLARSLDYESIPRGLARHAVPFLGDFCAVMLLDENGRDEGRTEMSWTEVDGGSRQEALMTGGLPTRLLADLSRRVMETGEAEVFSDIDIPVPQNGEASEFWSHVSSGRTVPPFELRSLVVVPLRARGRTLGTIAVGLRDGDRVYETADLALSEDLAGRAAIAIDNARLYRDIQENDRRKNEFLAMLAHELRNPLAPIRNAVEVLRMTALKEEDLQWANDVISRQVEQMVRLVDDLLDISRITGGKIQLRKETIDIALVVTRAVETSRPLIDGRKHQLLIALPSEPLLVEVDPVRFAQVIANLLNNAAKYTNAGGTIELDVARSGEEAVVQVRDDGIGISSEMLSHVFDLFTQVDRSLDRSQGGLGIGLTLVRRLVEKHGGSVEAQSDGINRGSRFIIRVPALADVAPAARATNEARPRKIAGPSRRILIVDDHPDVGRSLAKLLRLRGHEVRLAQDGAGALDEITQDEPEVVILDIGLPEMDGYQIAQAIRRRPGGESIVLIAVTGYGQDEDRRRSGEAGFDCHLVKPVDPDQLLSLLHSATTKTNGQGPASSLVVQS
ncbi:MAG: hypothetical protein JWN86_2728 [Planctomycetota bacterium]|nr:hypothetical protein [Planctomycetota bacterium]